MGRAHHVSQHSSSTALSDFLDAIIHNCQWFIHHERVGRFSWVIGLISGTYVSILASPSRACVYCNIHWQYAINMIANGNTQEIFTYANGTMPGSVHNV